MNHAKPIPYYASDGTSLGFRSVDAAKRLIAGGYVKPSYGRKGHLKAIWLQKDDGTNPVETHARSGTRYSFVENLEAGRCWKLRRLDRRDEDGIPASTRRDLFAGGGRLPGRLTRKGQIGGRHVA